MVTLGCVVWKTFLEGRGSYFGWHHGGRDLYGWKDIFRGGGSKHRRIHDLDFLYWVSGLKVPINCQKLWIFALAGTFASWKSYTTLLSYFFVSFSNQLFALELAIDQLFFTQILKPKTCWQWFQNKTTATLHSIIIFITERTCKIIDW